MLTSARAGHGAEAERARPVIHDPGETLPRHRLPVWHRVQPRELPVFSQKLIIPLHKLFRALSVFSPARLLHAAGQGEPQAAWCHPQHRLFVSFSMLAPGCSEVKGEGAGSGSVPAAPTAPGRASSFCCSAGQYPHFSFGSCFISSLCKKLHRAPQKHTFQMLNSQGLGKQRALYIAPQLSVLRTSCWSPATPHPLKFK